MNLQTIRAMIRQEAASRLMVGTVVSVDARGTNTVSVRVSGGRVHTRTYTCATGLEIGDKVLMARLAALDRVVIVGKLTDVEGTLRKQAILAPPDDLTVVGYAGFLVAEWSAYPGMDVCYQIQHNTTGSADGNEITAILSRGSYYLYPIVDDDTDTGDPTTHYFRVRAVRWLGDNNVMYSGWSAWTSDASVTWDGRYRTEGELASTNENEGASFIGIFDSAGNFSSTDVEGALEEAYDKAAGGGAPIGASYVVIALDGDLTAERVATAGTAISLTDGGAGSTLTFAVIPSDIDHGTIGGLGDDDHEIYLLADGSRNLAGDLGVDGGITVDGVDISAHAANNAAHHALITLDVNADALLSLNIQELGLDTQGANLVLAGPAAGGDAVPTFRSLATADLPVINHNDRPDLQGGQADQYYHQTAAQHASFAVVAGAGYALVSTGANVWAPSLTPGWQGTHVFSAGLSVAAAQAITMGEAATIGQAAGPLLTFNDAADTLVITGCNVGVGIAPTTRMHLYHATNHIYLTVETDMANGEAMAYFLNDAQNWRVGTTGGDLFTIRDHTAGVNVVTIEPGAPASSIYVDADGHVGHGANPTINQHFYIVDTAVATTATYYGIRCQHTRTGGATDHADGMTGVYIQTTYNNTGVDLGHFRGMQNVLTLTDGDIGNINIRNVQGFNNQAAANGGTITGGLYGTYNYVIVDGATVDDTACGLFTYLNLDSGTVSANAYGLFSRVDDDLGVTGTVYNLYLDNDTGVDWAIYSDAAAPTYFGGNVRINTLANAGNDDVHVDNNGMFINDPSDEKFKDNIEPLVSAEALEAVLNLRGCYFDWGEASKEVGDLGTRRQIGLIAQEVEPFIPLAVTDVRGEYKSVSAKKLIPFLVEAIKAQQERIEVLEAR